MRRLLCPLLCLLLWACAPQARVDNPLPRAAPSYVHFLQKQAMLTEAPAIVAQVSQTERLWLQGSGQGRTDVFLRAAPNWLELEPGAEPVFNRARSLLPQAANQGFNGLYLGQTGERQDIWLSKGASATDESAISNPASLHFDPHYGTDEEFAQLAQEAESLGLEVGSSLLPAATGIGPDFLLQARRAPEFAGLYAMLPMTVSEANSVPGPALPAAREEWDLRPLPGETVAALAREQVIPATLAREHLPWTSPGGWAVTGPVTGMDGVGRRWVYRYAVSPQQPLLAWPDPSGNAAKIFAAAVIRGTGLLGQSLVGLHFEPLLALEPGAGDRLSPGLDAINELSRQAHRYGGWTLQADAVPAYVIESVLTGEADFCRDDITEALALFGFLNADGRPLAALYRRWLGRNLDFTRLARGVNASAGLFPRILLAGWETQGQKLLELGPAITRQLLNQRLGADLAKWAAFRLVWRLGLPGLAFLSQEPLSSSIANMASTLKARKDLNLALGKPLGVTRGQGGGFGLLTALPEGGYWLLACNFGLHGDALNITLPGEARQAVDVASGEILPLEGRNFHIALDGRVAKNVVFVK